MDINLKPRKKLNPGNNRVVITLRQTGERIVKGYGTVTEIAMAERIQAEAYAVKACADDPQRCGGQWGFGGLDMPAGYTLAGMQAVGAATGPTNISSVEKKLDEVAKETKATKEGLKEFFRSRGKNSKSAKNAQ